MICDCSNRVKATEANGRCGFNGKKSRLFYQFRDAVSLQAQLCAAV